MHTADARALPRGLTATDAAARLVERGPNELPRPDRPTLAKRFVRELREPMALLLVAAASISGVLLGEAIDAIAILTIVVVNAVIALVQEGRAERVLEALEDLEAPHARVVRDGRRSVVDARDLVVGDVVVIQAGDRVPADLTVLLSDAMEIDESILTGESLAVAKQADGADGSGVSIGDRDGVAHAGTLVARGSGLGRVQATGPDTSLGAIATHLRAIRREPTPLQQQLSGLTRRLGIAAVFVAAAVFALTMLVQESAGPDEAFLTAVALAVAAVPEGLAAVTTVALALGVGRMATRGAIVRRLAAVETLGATDVLVIDKTGTITENRMQVAAILTPDGATVQPGEGSASLRSALRRIVVLCSDATLDPPTGDPTERALLVVADTSEIEADRAAAPRLASAPFTSERKRMGTIHQLDERLTLLVKGAPEVVIPRSATWLRDGESTALHDEDRARLESATQECAARGERVLALAQRELTSLPADPEDAEHDLVLVALVALRDPPRSSAASSVAGVRAAGMSLIMATGDHPATARAIAAEVGFDDARVMTGRQVRTEGLPADPTSVDIYARVDPDQKLELVTRLQGLGHTVAMTGDGVNDAPALRRADIGVALGETASDVAREAADLVITDDDLATIIAAVREGRAIWDNLRKVIDYLVTSNLAEVMVVVATILLVPALGVPLFPLQLLWINLLTDGLPALALGVDPVSTDVMAQQPRRRDSQLLDMPHLRRLASQSVVLAVGALAALLAAHHVLELEADAARTVLFTTLVLAQVIFAFVVRGRGQRPAEPNRWLRRSALAALLLQALIIVFPPAQTVFRTVVPPLGGWILILVGGVLAPGLLAARRRA